LQVYRNPGMRGLLLLIPVRVLNMFKTYIRQHPPGVQLIVFLAFWSALQLLFLIAVPVVLGSVYQVPSDKLQQFVNEELFQYPYLLFGLNFASAFVSFLLPALIFAYLADPAPARYLGLQRPVNKKHWLWVTLTGIMLVPSLGVLNNWMQAIDWGSFANELDQRRAKMLEQYLQAGNLGRMLLSLFFLALVPAIAEELFFRAVVFRFAHTWLKKWGLSVVVSSLLFAFYHGTISQFIPIFLAGALLALVYRYTSSLLLCILLHFLNNGIGLVISYCSQGSTDDMAVSVAVQVAVFAVATALVLLLLFRLKRSQTPLPHNWTVLYTEPQENA
jgi:membrane protease YdiL (CAAX protease family)